MNSSQPSILTELPQVLCFLDVETTGSSPQKGRVTEVGILKVSGWAGLTPTLESWSSLVRPDQSIPIEIQQLTGITNEMVANAPAFGELAERILHLTEGHIFVAHQARFDYGFIKAEMERCGRPFQAKTLCTVRLSQAMFPDRAPHSLDAIIARHRLTSTQRHRALGDALVLWEFLKKLIAEESHETLSLVLKKLMRHPSIPAHLPADQLQQIPQTPGVYLFYGLNQHPLYIGKSIHLRERVSEHFCLDYRSERGMRLATEIRRVQWEQTASDFGARLREIELIKTLMPAHNIALRKRPPPLWIRIHPESSKIEYIAHNAGDCQELSTPGLYPIFGPFVSRASVKHHLSELARREQLCLQALGLEKCSKREAARPCFNFQIRKCLGTCCSLESLATHAHRASEALAPWTQPIWTWGLVEIIEPAVNYACASSHFFRNWRWIESLSQDSSHSPTDGSAELGRGRPFDLNIYQLLRPILEGRPASAGLQIQI